MTASIGSNDPKGAKRRLIVYKSKCGNGGARINRAAHDLPPGWAGLGRRTKECRGKLRAPGPAGRRAGHLRSEAGRARLRRKGDLRIPSETPPVRPVLPWSIAAGWIGFVVRPVRS